MVAPRNNRIFVATLLWAGCLSGYSQQTHQTVRHHPTSVPETSAASALLDQAEALLTKGSYSGAVSVLQQATSKDPKSYQAWYDLGYAEQALGHTTEAVSAYQKSVEINPKVFETNLNLGLAFATLGRRADAATYLKAATELQPTARPEHAKAHAWTAYGRLQLANDPVVAADAFEEASKLLPSDPEPHLLLGGLYEGTGKLDEARNHYQQALAGAEGDMRVQALRGLVNVAVSSKHYPEAEANIRQYLAASPADSQAHLLLGRLLAEQGKKEEALAELTAFSRTNDPRLSREQADLLVALHREAEAAPIYKRLVEHDGSNAQLRYAYGRALMGEHQPAAAEEQFLAALKMNSGMTSTYGDLAVVAAENQHYDLALKALDVRSKVLGDNPGTYFLRATTLDHLRRYPEATQNYRQFLAAADGKYPDEEWKAKHRLIAIQNLK